MLYSVELGSQVEQLRGLLGDGDLYFGGGAAFFLLDAGLLAGEAAEVIDPCATDFTDLVHFDRVDERGVKGENTLNSDSVRHLADGERFRNAGAAFLEHDAAEFLDTFLDFTFGGDFLDLVGHGHGVTSLEVGIIFLFLCQRVAGNFHQIHFLSLL